jgi:hypothetical protein
MAYGFLRLINTFEAIRLSFAGSIPTQIVLVQEEIETVFERKSAFHAKTLAQRGAYLGDRPSRYDAASVQYRDSMAKMFDVAHLIGGH